MPAIVIDSRIFGDMFGTSAMRALFSDRAMVQRYLDVVAALARAQGSIGVIPGEAAAAIAAVAQVERVDFDHLAKRTQIVGYPILPLVEQLATWAGAAGRWCHWGATTQDIMDTADVLQLRDALDLVDEAALVIAEHAHSHPPIADRAAEGQHFGGGVAAG